MTDPPAEPIAVASRGGLSRLVVVVGAVVLALLAGLLVWLLTRGDDGGDKVVSAPVGRPVAVDDAQLRAFGRAQATPVYWAGARPNTTYELTRAAGKRKGYTAVTAQSGALIVYNRRRHASVYFTFPDAAFQVEAYDPRPGQALASVLRGGIVQLR